MDQPSAGDGIRAELLKRIAEQAMSDPAFRSAARDDLVGALVAYGYDLNEGELALVTRFRASLADAGVDLDLVDTLGPDHLARLFNHDISR